MTGVPRSPLPRLWKPGVAFSTTYLGNYSLSAFKAEASQLQRLRTPAEGTGTAEVFVDRFRASATRAS